MSIPTDVLRARAQSSKAQHILHSLAESGVDVRAALQSHSVRRAHLEHLDTRSRRKQMAIMTRIKAQEREQILRDAKGVPPPAPYNFGGLAPFAVDEAEARHELGPAPELDEDEARVKVVALRVTRGWRQYRVEEDGPDNGRCVCVRAYVCCVCWRRVCCVRECVCGNVCVGFCVCIVFVVSQSERYWQCVWWWWWC